MDNKEKVTIGVANGNTVDMKEQHNFRKKGWIGNDDIRADGYTEQWANEECRSAREIVNEYFKPIIEEYNHGKKPSRQKDFDYYGSLWSDEMYNRTGKAYQDKRKSQTPYPVNELILGVYDKDLNVKIPFEEKKEMLREYFEGFKDRNPNMLVVNASAHFDEANPHIHLDYTPIAHYETGMRERICMSRALKEMGFESAGRMDNAEQRWVQRERQILEDICKAHGYEVAHPQREDAEKRKEHLTVDEYKEAKREHDNKINELKTYEQFEEENLQFLQEATEKATKLQKAVAEAPSFMWEKYKETASIIDKEIAEAPDELKPDLFKNRSYNISKKLKKEVVYPKCKEVAKYGTDDYKTYYQVLNSEIAICRQREKPLRGIQWLETEKGLSLKNAVMQKAKSEINKDIKEQRSKLNELNSEMRRLVARIGVTYEDKSLELALYEKEVLSSKIDEQKALIDALKSNVNEASKKLAVQYLSDITPKDITLIKDDYSEVCSEWTDKADKLLFYLENDVEIAIDYVNGNPKLQQEVEASEKACKTQLEQLNERQSVEAVCQELRESLEQLKPKKNPFTKKEEWTDYDRKFFYETQGAINRLERVVSNSESNKDQSEIIENLKAENNALKEANEINKAKAIESNQKAVEQFLEREDFKNLIVAAQMKGIDLLSFCKSKEGLDTFSRVCGKNKSDTQQGLEKIVSAIEKLLEGIDKGIAIKDIAVEKLFDYEDFER